MSKIIIASLSAAALFLGVLLCLRIGWRVGRRRLAELGENSHAGLGSVEGIVFAMVGLLIAFTFTGAATRFDTRRDLIIQQVNAIGTAWLRLDLLGPLHVIGFAAVMALSVYLILDLEYPRLGLIQIGKFDEALRVLRTSMDVAGGRSGALRE
jgi:hypothetical protein